MEETMLVTPSAEDMEKLAGKRFQVVIGFAMLPQNAQVMYAGPHYYGKLKYEDAVAVQAILAKYQDSFLQMMQPAVDELMGMGILQSAALAESRKTK